MEKLLNGLNNGRDTTDGVGGRPGLFNPSTPKLTVEVNLKQLLRPWGNYTAKGQTILLYDNVHFKDKQFLELCKKHQVRILPDLFSEIPNDKE